jgi:ABC-2 type transport system ATP-binding protein
MTTLPKNKPLDDDAILVGTDLTKFYPKATLPALNKFNVTIFRGEIFGLLGPNGAGKTTAISLMSATMSPTSGTIRVCGLDLAKRPTEVKDLIGLVPQDIALYPDLTARENLIFFGRMHGLGGKSLKERIDHVLELICLEEKANQPVHTYSGGMKRRANLAVGLLHCPQLLFLDEPTVGIDAQSRHMILEKLISLREDGTTMVYTTHYMEEAQQLCNRVAIIDEGEVIAEGAPTVLIKNRPKCANLGALFLALTGKDLRE